MSPPRPRGGEREGLIADIKKSFLRCSPGLIHQGLLPPDSSSHWSPAVVRTERIGRDSYA